MKKILLTLTLIIAILPIYSLQVDQETITINKAPTAEFENYVGPHLFYNTVNEIRDIGAYLATKITPDTKSEGNYSNKYLMYHKPKLEWEQNITACDIFEITSAALVDNIANIKLILSQYLIDNYGYTLEDSNLIAQLLVMYNAVYRGDSKHLAETYTTEAAIVNNAEYIGIDLSYYNWPGKTNIYIPLSDNIFMGSLSSVDTDKILDDKVIDLIAEELDDQIEFREEIVDFKEREIDQVTTKLEETKNALEEEKENITELLKADPENQEFTEQLENIEEQLEEQTITENVVEEKEEKILELRDDLAEDKNDLIDIKQNTKAYPSGIPYMLNRREGNTILGTLLNITPDGTTIIKGPVNSIRNNTFKSKNEYLYIIAGGNNENQMVTIGKLKENDLTVITWGDTKCYYKSPIMFQRDKIYSIIEINDIHYIGEFNTDLKLERQSPTAIIKDTYIILKDGTFYIQGENNSIELVNLADFTTILE